VSQTLLMIKPDATERNLIGHILNRIEKAGFKVVRMRMVYLSEADAREFYKVHEGKPFLDSLVAFMSSGAVVPMVLEKDNAVAAVRELIGATNPENAAIGTIRQEIALNIEKNSVHASDSDENAAKEIAFFFGDK